MNTLPEVQVPNVTKNKHDYDPYCVGFVVSNHGNFVLKGWHEDIEAYLKTLKGYMWYMKANFYKDKKFREVYYNSNSGMFNGYNGMSTYIHKPTFNKKHSKVFHPYKFTIYRGEDYKKTFKRLPKHWIKEFDEIF